MIGINSSVQKNVGFGWGIFKPKAQEECEKDQQRKFVSHALGRRAQEYRSADTQGPNNYGSSEETVGELKDAADARLERRLNRIS